MKAKILILVMVLMVGCASIQYDADTGSFAYNRFGSQEIDGLKVEKGMDGVVVTLDSQKSEIEMAEVMNNAIETIEKALKILDEIQKKFPGLF